MTERMDDNELARLLLRYAELEDDLSFIKEQITEQVLMREESVNVGSVKAVYYKGRRRYDYAAALEEADVPFDAMEKYKKFSYDFKKACDELEITDIPFTQSPPSVSIRTG